VGWIKNNKIFFELLFGIFKLINNYAIAKTMVPEAFDPEELFNNDFKVTKKFCDTLRYIFFLSDEMLF
jgi:hypothetical protein